MMRVTVDDRAVRKAFDQDAVNMAEAVAKAEQVAAESVTDRARALAPVRSGRLRRSVRTERNATVAGGSLAPYAGVIEHGRRRPYTRAQPFLAPAARQADMQVVEVFDRAVAAALEA